MKQITKHTLAILSLILILSNLQAANIKVQDVCSMLKFAGAITKNKETKQKEPSGEGSLFVYNGNGKKNIVEIKGFFESANVSNADLFIYGVEVYHGELECDYQYDKKTKN